MKLIEEAYRQYLKIHQNLLHFVSTKEGFIDKNLSKKEFIRMKLENILSVRNKLYQKSSLINLFVKGNPYKLSKEELEIAEGFKNFKIGVFFILNHLKNHTIFLGKDSIGYDML